MKKSLLMLSVGLIVSGCGVKQATNPTANVATTQTIHQPAINQPTNKDDIAPEHSTGHNEQRLVSAQNFMVASANPLATQAGFDILAKGGNAVDAMIAVQTTLGLTEPQSSGLGGGAFVVYWDNKTKQLTTFDARETAPAAINADVFLDKNGEPLAFMSAVVGGQSVGVPAIPRLLELMHKRYGHLPWGSLFDMPIRLAKDGFYVSERLSQSITQNQEHLARYDTTRQYFMPTGKPLKAGELLKNPDYAHSVMVLASQGATPFYDGVLAQNIVNAVQKTANASTLAMSDLQAYQVVERPPVCQDYRQYQLCGMGAPSSGGIALGQIFGILNHYPDSPKANALFWRWLGDASALAFADRQQYVGDPDFVNVPTNALLDDRYLKQRADLIANKDTALTDIAAGEVALELPSTSHIVIVDSAGNVLSMTSSIENAFGSTVMANGYLLNNELTDFNFKPTDAKGMITANAVQAGKRPRSSMAPTIVLKDGLPYMAIGSPGGSRIIGYVAKTLIAHLDFGMDIQTAISYPNLLNRGSTYELEQHTAIADLAPTLETMGYNVKVRDLNSGVQAIVIDRQNGQLQGGADPRREGKVMGE